MLGRRTIAAAATTLAVVLAGCSSDDGPPVQDAAARLVTLTGRAHAALDRISAETVPWSVGDDATGSHDGGCPSGKRYARYLATVDQAVSPAEETRANRESQVVGVLSGDWKLVDQEHQDVAPFDTKLSFTARGKNPGGLRLHVSFDQRGTGWHVVLDGRTACLEPGDQ